MPYLHILENGDGQYALQRSDSVDNYPNIIKTYKVTNVVAYSAILKTYRHFNINIYDYWMKNVQLDELISILNF